MRALATWARSVRKRMIREGESQVPFRRPPQRRGLTFSVRWLNECAGLMGEGMVRPVFHQVDARHLDGLSVDVCSTVSQTLAELTSQLRVRKAPWKKAWGKSGGAEKLKGVGSKEWNWGGSDSCASAQQMQAQRIAKQKCRGLNHRAGVGTDGTIEARTQTSNELAPNRHWICLRQVEELVQRNQGEIL